MNGLKKKREQVRPGERLEMSGHAKQLGSPGGCRKLLRVEKKRNAISVGLVRLLSSFALFVLRWQHLSALCLLGTGFNSWKHTKLPGCFLLERKHIFGLE